MSEKLAEFIEGMGVIAQADGLPRIAGRLIAFMVIEEGPFSFSDLAIKLSVSRASISTNTRLLESMGIIDRVGKPGDRQDYFKLAEDPYVKLLHGLNFRMNKAKKLIENTKKDLPDGISKDRLQALHAFYHAMINSQLQLIETMEQGHNS
jgi:DNA-binding transcriptional regulator GbsR (MarR family)